MLLAFSLASDGAKSLGAARSPARTSRSGRRPAKQGFYNLNEYLFGVYPILLALRAGKRTFKTLWIQQRRGPVTVERKDDEARQEIEERSKSLGVQLFRCFKRDVLDEHSGGRPHQGLVLKCTKPSVKTVEELPRPSKGALWLALEGVTDPMNLGSLLRSAAFFGVEGVICENGCARYSPVAAKASAGAGETMEIFHSRDLETLLPRAQRQGWLVVGAALPVESAEPELPRREPPYSSLEELQTQLDQGVLLLLGPEGPGLRTEVRRGCDRLVGISRAGENLDGLDSLNVGVAAGIALHALRTALGPPRPREAPVTTLARKPRLACQAAACGRGEGAEPYSQCSAKDKSKRWDGEAWEEAEDWQEEDWEDEDWEDEDWEDADSSWQQGQSSSSRAQRFSSRPSPAPAPKPAVPKAAQVFGCCKLHSFVLMCERIGSASVHLRMAEAPPVPCPPVLGLAPDALPKDIQSFGWTPLEDLSGDCNGIDLALLLARNSSCKAGSMGCAIADQSGMIIAGHVNGPVWEPNAKRPASDLHAEVNAIGRCARLGRSTEGSSVYITMPPCKRCFMALVAAGVRRIVTRKEFLTQDSKDIQSAARRLDITVRVVADTAARRERLDKLCEPIMRPFKRKRDEDADAQSEAETKLRAPPRSAKKLQARLPEELGFSVGSGVRNKGWEIGEMEDGVRPADDGEPDVFFSHSYSDNCRRVDMGLFECNCPNSLSCCSHLYAACVALPQYRHRAAFLWALRQDLGAAAGSEENPSTRSWSSRAPRGGFEGCRRRVKAALLRHLPLEDVADAAVDAAVGMWVRVEWLRQGRLPKLGAYWADAVERSLGDAVASTDVELGAAAQDRIRNLLGKLRMKQAELAPLLLALAQGRLQESERPSQRWEGLCRHFWAQVAAAEVPGRLLTAKRAKVPSSLIAQQKESTLLEVNSFSQLQVPKDGSDCYRSFAEMISDWTEAPKDLRFGSGDGGPCIQCTSLYLHSLLAMALFRVEGQVELSQQGAMLRLVPQGARPPQQPGADVPLNPQAPTTRPTMANILQQAQDGVIVIHGTRLPLTRGRYHRLLNNVARAEGLPTGTSGSWSDAAHLRMVCILGESMRESRRKPMLAIEDENTADQEGNPPLAIHDIVQNNPEDNEVPSPAISDMVENNAEDKGVPPQDSSSSSSSSIESESTPPLPTYQEVLQWESDWADTYHSAVSWPSSCWVALCSTRPNGNPHMVINMPRPKFCGEAAALSLTPVRETYSSENKSVRAHVLMWVVLGY
ncbi:MRM1 [Symbiodinium microadriaticum]|nr:MRM1 [Symbiodinium microadriaticum]